MDTTALIVDLLRSIGRSDPHGLQRLAEFADWPQAARDELERRATRVLQALDEESLHLVASGTLSMASLCRQAESELNQARSRQ